MGESTTSSIVDALAAIFPARIDGAVAIHVAPPVAPNGAAPNGAGAAGLTRAEIKSARSPRVNTALPAPINVRFRRSLTANHPSVSSAGRYLGRRLGVARLHGHWLQAMR